MKSSLTSFFHFHTSLSLCHCPSRFSSSSFSVSVAMPKRIQDTSRLCWAAGVISGTGGQPGDCSDVTFLPASPGSFIPHFQSRENPSLQVHPWLRGGGLTHLEGEKSKGFKSTLVVRHARNIFPRQIKWKKQIFARTKVSNAWQLSLCFVSFVCGGFNKLKTCDPWIYFLLVGEVGSSWASSRQTGLFFHKQNLKQGENLGLGGKIQRGSSKRAFFES